VARSCCANLSANAQFTRRWPRLHLPRF
jgi:hypothetical protein